MQNTYTLPASSRNFASSDSLVLNERFPTKTLFLGGATSVVAALSIGAETSVAEDIGLEMGIRVG